MEEIISDFEKFKGKTLYDYRIIFHSIDKNQRDFLIAHFQDYAWELGLAIAHCAVSVMPKVGLLKIFLKNEADIEFQFKSSKRFCNKHPCDWNDADLKEILDTRLIGKEQFFSDIWASELNMEDKDITFFDQYNKEYQVLLSKGSDIIEKS